MSENTISNEEWNTLIKLGKDIQGTFTYGDPNGHGVPSFTNRMALLDMFKEYLEIHNITTYHNNVKTYK